MKFSQIKGIAVVDLQDARKLGDLEDLMLDPTSRQFLELKVKTGLFGSHTLIPINWLKNIGQDAITVIYDSSAAGGDTSAKTDEAKLSGMSQVLDNQVVTDSGTLLGHIKDILLNPSTLDIEGYKVSLGGLFSKTQMFPATIDVRYGGKLVTVPATLIEQ